MGDADGRFGLVDVLAAGAARAHGVDLEVGLVDDEIRLLRDRKHRDGRGGGVDASLRLGRRHALDPMHAALELEAGEYAAARDLGDDFLVAAGRPSLIDRTSTFQRFDSAYLTYMRKRSPAKRAASSPPVPARTSRIASPSSAASFGRRARRIAFSISSASVSAAASSALAMARISASRSRILQHGGEIRPLLLLGAKAPIAATTGSRSLSSRESAEYSAPETPSVRRAPISRWRRRMRSRLSLAAMGSEACRLLSTQRPPRSRQDRKITRATRNDI